MPTEARHGAATPCGDAVEERAAESLPVDVVVALIHCRLAALRRAGCGGEGCYRLAGRLDVDLDEALALVAGGCEPDLALRILR